MDIYTKIFLLNWLALIVALGIDVLFLGDAIQKNKATGWLLGLWCASAFISVPVWVAWIIVRS